MPYPKQHGSRVVFPHCSHCDRWVWPSALLCPDCHNPVGERVWRGEATVVAEVTVHRGVAPELLAQGPYRLVKVDCGGFFLITRWVSPDVPASPRQPCDLRWGEVRGRPWPVAAANERTARAQRAQRAQQPGLTAMTVRPEPTQRTKP